MNHLRRHKHLNEHLVRQRPAAEGSLLQNAPRDLTIHEAWQILVRRRKVFAISFATIVLVAILWSLLIPTRYEAVGRLTIDFESSGAADLQGLAQVAGGMDPETKLQTQVNVLQSDSLAWDVIQRLRLDQGGETSFLSIFGKSNDCSTPLAADLNRISPECRQALLDEFHRRLRVQSVPHTEIIEVRFRSRRREVVANVVNTLIDAYIERNFKTKYQASLRISSWLSGQLDDVKRNAELAEEKFIAYQKRTGVIGTDENHNVLIERLNALNQQLVVAESNRIVREARYRVALNGEPEALAEIVPGSRLQLLHAEETNLRDQYAQLDAKFGDAYPRVQQVKAQLEQAAAARKDELEHIRQRIKSEYDASLNGESILRGECETQKQQAYDTNEAAIQVALLKRDVDASRELYEQLSKKLNEAGIVAGLKATNVTVIDPANIPVRPVEPRIPINLALGMFAGVLCGISLCFLRENMDTTIGSPLDIADLLSIPSLGIVPRQTAGPALGKIGGAASSNGKYCVAALESPESETADAYRSLRTSLLLSSAGAPPKVLLITSPLPREGKTTTSINTAVVFAQKKRRVLLVDADLRRADMFRCFDFPNNGGLSAALAGQEPEPFYIQHPHLRDLTILPAGARPPKPPDLLDSERMRALVQSWRERFDHVIIDAPPLIGMSDAVILATMADAVVLVLRAEQSQRHDLLRAQAILASVNARVSGAIINDFSSNSYLPYGYDPSLYRSYFNGAEGGNGRGKH